MANPNKVKGTRWESARVEWWRSQGEAFEFAHRVALAGSSDKGDVHVVQSHAGAIIEECKNAKRIELTKWLREADAEQDNAGAFVCAVALKLPGVGMTDPGAHPVAMYSRDWARVLMELLRLGDEVARLKADNAALRERRYYA